jgi:hypothetical protein
MSNTAILFIAVFVSFIGCAISVGSLLASFRTDCQASASPKAATANESAGMSKPLVVAGNIVFDTSVLIKGFMAVNSRPRGIEKLEFAQVSKRIFATPGNRMAHRQPQLAGQQ